MRKIFRNLFFFSAFLIGLISLSSCKVAKNLPERQTLLVKNKFTIHGKMKSGEKQRIREDLAQITVQKTNRKFIGIMPFRMWLYYSATHKKKLTKFRQWIIDKVGEPPVVYDSTSTVTSKNRIETYLFNYGYFNNQVTDTFFTKKKKTTVVYNVKTNDVWKIGDVELPKRHTECDSIVREARKNTFLRRGDRFEITNLKNERDRIETVLRSRGFYFFSREYITFELDSNSQPKTVRIKITINPPNDSTEHERYRINNIYVITDYSAQALEDTMLRDTLPMNEYFFISQKQNFKPNVLTDVIFFRKGGFYSKEREQRTINRLSSLGTFKFISIDFTRANRDSNYLDCRVYLTPAKRQSISATLEANVTNEGFFGLLGSLSYKNKNLSKRADQLLVDVSSGVQLRFSKEEKVQVMNTNAKVSATYYLNRFLVPASVRNKFFSRNTNPKTRFNVNYTFEDRYDFKNDGTLAYLYQLHQFALSFGYEWNENAMKHHLLNPFTASFFLLPKRGSEFTDRLNANSPLKSSYEEQLSIGPNYSFTYSNQRTNTDRKYMYFRTNIETAGNVIYSAFKLANLKNKNDSIFLIANRPFSQYFRIEGDWRNYFRMNNHSMFAMRMFTGIGVPYGNSRSLPFVKQFFVGGPNSLRGFLIREVGPGGYVDESTYNRETGEKNSIGFFNQTGDLKLELNAEIRFDIYKWLKAAVFADAGNVWLLRKDTRQLGEFNIKRFWNEFAIDAGAGIRLDFNFFVIRFDYGFPIRDPRRVEGKRWQFQNGQAFKTGQFQLAIGYPF